MSHVCRGKLLEKITIECECGTELILRDVYVTYEAKRDYSPIQIYAEEDYVTHKCSDREPQA